MAVGEIRAKLPAWPAWTDNSQLCARGWVSARTTWWRLCLGRNSTGPSSMPLNMASFQNSKHRFVTLLKGTSPPKKNLQNPLNVLSVKDDICVILKPKRCCMRNAWFKVCNCMRMLRFEACDCMKKVRFEVWLHEKCAVRSTNSLTDTAF